LKATQFYAENKELLDCKKSGYCAWKPYIILDALKKYKKVLYLDSSMLFSGHIFEFISKRNALLSTVTELKNKRHTKKETFQIMGCDTEEYCECNQVWAGVILATRKAEKFLNEWLHYCTIKDCVSNDFDKSINPDLVYCLFDQSIYSTLYKKYKMPYQSNCPTGKYFFFADTREYPHRDVIIRTFGERHMKNQDILIANYFQDYITNGSCCYDPRPYLPDKIEILLEDGCLLALNAIEKCM